MRARESGRATWNGFSTSSIGCTRRTEGASALVWGCDLPRFCRGYGRHRRGRYSLGSIRRSVHDQLSCWRGPGCGKGDGRMIGSAAPMKVLVVDDEPAIRRFLRTSLMAQGYQVIEAENGTGALEHLRHSTVDILVLDLG